MWTHDRVFLIDKFYWNYKDKRKIVESFSDNNWFCPSSATSNIDKYSLFFSYFFFSFLTPFLAILNLKTRFLGHFDGRPNGRTPDFNYPRGTLGGYEKKSTKKDKNNTPPHLPHCVRKDPEVGSKFVGPPTHQTRERSGEGLNLQRQELDIGGFKTCFSLNQWLQFLVKVCDLQKSYRQHSAIDDAKWDES